MGGWRSVQSNAFADTEAQRQICGLKTVVEISALGTSVNFSNTSRGQREREIISMWSLILPGKYLMVEGKRVQPRL